MSVFNQPIESREAQKEEESARKKLEDVKRFLFGALLKVMSKEEIKERLRKLEAKGHSQFE